MKRVQEAGRSLPDGQLISDISKIVIDRDPRDGESTGQAWFTSTDRACVTSLVEAHSRVRHTHLTRLQVWIKYRLRVTLMEVTYDVAEEEWEEEEKAFNLRTQQKMLYRRRKRLNK